MFGNNLLDHRENRTVIVIMVLEEKIVELVETNYLSHGQWCGSRILYDTCLKLLVVGLILHNAVSTQIRTVGRTMGTVTSAISSMTTAVAVIWVVMATTTGYCLWNRLREWFGHSLHGQQCRQGHGYHQHEGHLRGKESLVRKSAPRNGDDMPRWGGSRPTNTKARVPTTFMMWRGEGSAVASWEGGSVMFGDCVLLLYPGASPCAAGLLFW